MLLKLEIVRSVPFNCDIRQWQSFNSTNLLRASDTNPREWQELIGNTIKYKYSVISDQYNFFTLNDSIRKIYLNCTTGYNLYITSYAEAAKGLSSVYLSGRWFCGNLILIKVS